MNYPKLKNLNPVTLERFVSKDKNALWNFYRDKNCAEFWRRFPPTWRLEDIEKIEELTGGQIFTVWFDNEIIGFACISKVCWYELGAQVGLGLFKHYQDVDVNGLKLALWATLVLAEIFFDKMNLQRMSFVFLRKRNDIKKTLLKAGLRLEGRFKKRILFEGVRQDELEYCLDKYSYDKRYKG